MLNKFVDKVFVINLPHRKDRLDQFDIFAKKFQFEYEVFEAFDGKKNIDENFIYDGKKVGNPYINLNYFKGHVGCLLSHLELIKYCKKMNYSTVMIFEDDCAFVDDFNQKLELLFSNIDKDWQFLYLSGSLPEFTEHFNFYSRINKILTTHSYLMKSEIFDIVIENFTQKVFSKEVDTCYSDIHAQVKTYVSMPFITYQFEGYSDIGEGYREYYSIKKYL